MLRSEAGMDDEVLRVSTPVRRHPSLGSALLLLVGCGAALLGQSTSFVRELYFGEAPPGDRPAILAPEIFSGRSPVHGTPVFSPDGTEAYWSAIDPASGTVTILFTRHESDGWTDPAIAPFTSEDQDDVPFITPDGRTLFFVSDRPVPGASETKKQNVWRVARTASGWTAPVPLTATINAFSLHWQVSVAGDGTLCFATEGAGDIYCSESNEGSYAPPRRLGSAINTAFPDVTPFLSRDKSFLVFARSGSPDGFGGSDLYVSFGESEASWTPAVNLGPEVNSAGQDLCPIVSPDGRYLFFLSTRDGMSRVWWVDAEVIHRLHH